MPPVLRLHPLLERLRRGGLALLLCGPWLAGPAAAQPRLSDASALSALPVALSVAAPAGLLAAGGALSLVAVQASAEGTRWVLQRASDGAQLSLELSAGVAAAVGTQLQVVALASGWVLSAAGQALCFIPNDAGARLMHHQQVTW